MRGDMLAIYSIGTSRMGTYGAMHKMWHKSNAEYTTIKDISPKYISNHKLMVFCDVEINPIAYWV